MNATTIRFALIASLGAGLAVPAAAQDFPPTGYAPLMFGGAPPTHVFRLAGAPWVCVADSICKPLRVEGMAERDVLAAEIAPLGFADRRFLLSFQHPSHDKGRPVVLSCMDDKCARLDSSAGDSAYLGTFQVKQADKVSGRTAILRNVDVRGGRSQILWCAETGCAELPATRDTEYRLAFMGVARQDGREKIWLRDAAGAVITCVQPEVDVDDRLDCERSTLAMTDFPRGVATTTAPPPQAVTPPPAAAPGDADRLALAAAIDQALRADDAVTSERLLTDAVRRYPGYGATWAPFQQRLVNVKAMRDRQARAEEARGLTVEARRLARFGDFAGAERFLQEADRLSPGLAETTSARAEIAQLRAERGQRYRERYQYNAAIERALSTYSLWEAEGLIAEALQRYPNDPGFRAQANELAQIRQRAEWQGRVTRARAAVVTGRRALERGDFYEAERQLALADDAAPGLPEANQLRADLGRARARAGGQNDQIRLLVLAIEAAILARRYDDADRYLRDGTARYPTYPGWNDDRRRLTAARGGDDRQTREQRDRRDRAAALVAQARQVAAQGDFTRAAAMLNEANTLTPGAPEIAIARADIERQRADRQRDESDIRALAASVDSAIARRQFDDADRLIADGRRRSPGYVGWADLSRRVVDARRAADARPPAAKPTDVKPAETKPGEARPPQTGPAESKPAPKPEAKPGEARPPQTKPAETPPGAKPAETKPAEARPPQVKPADAPPAAKPPEPKTGGAPPPAAKPAEAPPPPVAKPAEAKPDANPQLAARVGALVARAREAIGRNDFDAAERAVAEAEGVDRTSRDVIAVRAELEAAERRGGRRDRGKN
ncbi:MAG: hypothetical protein IPK81_21975 [Rhodospirillales bacterium]|nr:MAG: hypothetical protein IPK81_21975 [Rhodospirillales bacterium]